MDEDEITPIEFTKGIKSTVFWMHFNQGEDIESISNILGYPELIVRTIIDGIEVKSFQFEATVAHGESIQFGVDGPIRTRRKFATHHLTSAANNARIAGIIENHTKGRQNSEYINGVDVGRHRTISDSHVITSFISSFAAVEVEINEFLHEIEESPKNFDDDLVDRLQGLLNSFPGNFLRDTRTEAKYQLILSFTGSNTFETGAEPWQSVQIVRDLRNYFVHHKPEIIEFDDDGPLSTRIGSKLKTKEFELSPQWEDKEVPFFPHKCLSYGCAKWALESCLTFIEEFYDKLGVEHSLSPSLEIIKSEMEVDWIGGYR